MVKIKDDIYDYLLVLNKWVLVELSSVLHAVEQYVNCLNKKH